MIAERAGAPLRAVFLDIGDTVMRPNPSWEHVYAIAFQEYGVEVEVEALRAALQRAYHHGGFGFDDGFEASEETSFARTMEIDRAALADLGIGPMPEAFFRRLSELFMLTSNWHVFPDVAPALSVLRDRGLVIGAVSNWVWQLPELLHALKLVRYFDFIAASARVGFQKPHIGIFRWALAQAQAEPEEAIHVGDHLDADVAGARSAGIQPVLIDRRDRFGPDDLPAGTPRIRTLAELIPIVDARILARTAGR
jgi:putative hydrolase of the HAD superfamily